MSEEIITTIGIVLLQSLFFAILFVIFYFFKKVKFKIEKTFKKKNKHLETILHSGFSSLGKEAMVQLYNMAFDDEQYKEWIEKNHHLNQDEPEYIDLNNKSEVVFYLRYYQKKEYDVKNIFERIKNEYE